MRLCLADLPRYQDPPYHTDSTPERNLWAWCLYSGVLAADDGDPVDSAWVWSEEYRIGSFTWICDALGVDDEAIRDRLKSSRPVRWKQRKVSRWISL
jgi:hypothetical protein